MASAFKEMLENINNGRKQCIKNAKLANLPATDNMSISDIAGLFLQQNNTELINPNNPVQGGGWKRPTDWWDTKSILENAEEKDGLYPAYILLLADWEDTTIFTRTTTNMALYGDGYLTSDGSWYVSQNDVTHTWDKTKDKECSEGYKTRYVIVYTSSKDISNRNIILTQFLCLECIIGDVKNKIKFSSNSITNSNKTIMNLECLESTTFHNLENVCQYCSNIKSINLTTSAPLIAGSYIFCGCYSLVSVSLPSLTTCGSSAFQSCYSLVSVSLPSLTTCGTSMFHSCYSLVSVSLPSLTTCGTSVFQSCYSLSKFEFLSTMTDIKNGIVNIFDNTYNLKQLILYNDWDKSGLDVSKSNLIKSCIIDIFDKLADVTEAAENTYTLIIGPNNLGKVTAEEIAVATNKGWIIS